MICSRRDDHIFRPPSSNEFRASIAVDNLKRLADRRRLAEILVQRGGEVALSLRGSLTASDIRSTNDAADIVTEGDLRVQELIAREVTRLDPEAILISEEMGGPDVRSTHQEYWVLDPIDGTLNYVSGLPGWVVSLGYRGALGEVGAIYDPIAGELVSAATGSEPTLNGNALHLPAVERSMGSWILGTGLPHDSQPRRSSLERIAEVLDGLVDVRISGSCAFDAIQLVTGRLDVYMRQALFEWDVAAAVAIFKSMQVPFALVRSTDVPFGVDLFIAGRPLAFTHVCRSLGLVG